MSSNLEKLNEFYKLKTSYENQLAKDKAKILKNTTLSWKEKRNEFRKFKTKCIKCKRPVGNIFTIKLDSSNEEKSGKNLKAKCGDLIEPCNFVIDYFVPETTLYTDTISKFEKEIIGLKNDVINTKNKLLFGYASTENAVEKFDTLKTYINDTSSVLEYLIDKYTDVVDNKEKNDNTFFYNRFRQKTMIKYVY